MPTRNESGFHRAELTSRDLLDYVVGLVGGILLWIVNSMSATSTLVFDPTWTAVGVASGLGLFAVFTFWGAGRRFQLGLRELEPRSLAVLAVGFFLFLWLLVEIDVAFRPAHYSWLLGLGLSQLLGIALYLRQRASG